MTWSSLPKQWVRNDPEAHDKAVHMIRRGKSDQQVSDYLGMTVAQVEAIRREAYDRTGDMLEDRKVNGSPYVAPHHQGDEADLYWQKDAARGSRALALAVQRYLDKHHRSAA